ncbi:Protein RCC2 [Chionoecetes opilio]|uniref:Protein RCC2 n=1 Tax=Chionoecetes opilio TaxID=41210 RepID=A0A8J4XTI6_CHIOP|nr:Protein RCC2 [Chionoecetes opilio]
MAPQLSHLFLKLNSLLKPDKNSTLGLGENTKSSTTAKEVKALEGSHVQQITCGMGHTVLLVREETEQDKEILDRLKEITLGGHHLSKHNYLCVEQSNMSRRAGMPGGQCSRRTNSAGCL